MGKKAEYKWVNWMASLTADGAMVMGIEMAEVFLAWGEVVCTASPVVTDRVWPVVVVTRIDLCAAAAARSSASSRLL